MVLTSVSQDEILQGFSELGIVLGNKSIIDKLLELCERYNKDAVSVADEWFAFITSKHLDSIPTEESLSNFENDRLTDQRKLARTPKTPLSTPKTRQYNANDSLGDVDQLLKAYGTPEILGSSHIIKRQKTTTSHIVSKEDSDEDKSCDVDVTKSVTASASSSPVYKARTNSGDVVHSFGNIDINWTSSDENSKCLVRIHDNASALTECYKYMFEKKRMASLAINSKIEFMEDAYKESAEVEEFSNLALLSTEEMDVAGQITSDGNGRLNSKSVLIEGSFRTSSGKIAALDLRKLTSFSFFPGQIVALKAMNGGGQKWGVSKIHPIPFPAFPKTDLKFAEKKERPSFIIAAGPYTTLDSLSYKPLEDLLQKVKEIKPTVCILIGPFVDGKRMGSEADNCDTTYEDLFEKCMEIISNVSTKLNTQFIIVSSSNDAHHDCIYPTPPFTYESKKNLNFVSDPSMLEFDGIVFGITATDILFHLGKEEITFPPGTPDRIGRLASHLLLQRSFYPLYPPSEGMNISMPKLQIHGRMSVTPHFLILPSDLSSFIKDINGCCCINPRRLTCGNDGGTYAHIVITPDPIEPGSSLVSNISAKVVRI
ncbi:DNA polymerase alpha subunit B [Chamberlinius hualienensis]